MSVLLRLQSLRQHQVSLLSSLRYPPLQHSLRRSFHATGSVSQSSTSTAAAASKDDTGDGESNTDNNGKGMKNKQDFVKSAIMPGEWDPDHFQNPLHRPKYDGRAKILANEDYRNRPTVGFSANFNEMADGMITLSWMTHDERQSIFEMYKNFLIHGHTRYGVTSHEYVVRMIANKKNLTAERVAGVIQLQFNEAKYRIELQRSGGTSENKVYDEAGKYMDNAIMTEIRDCYKAWGMKPPADLNFVEPIPEPGKGQSVSWREMDDVVDFDELWRQYEREHLPKKAKDLIANHVYLEDVDDDQVPTPVDKETMAFAQQQERLTKAAKEAESEATPPELQATDEDAPDRRRERFKFVAQMVNTRTLTQRRKKANEKPLLGWRQHQTRQLLPRTYHNKNSENTLVEKDGAIRPATLHDIKNVAWKPQRHDMGKYNTLEESVAVQEFVYREAKLDWLNFVNGRPHSGVFGTNAADEAAAEEEAKKKKEQEEEEEELLAAEAAAAEETDDDAETEEKDDIDNVVEGDSEEKEDGAEEVDSAAESTDEKEKESDDDNDEKPPP